MYGGIFDRGLCVILDCVCCFGVLVGMIVWLFFLLLYSFCWLGVIVI